jgi:hypothetical protein
MSMELVNRAEVLDRKLHRSTVAFAASFRSNVSGSPDVLQDGSSIAA